MKKDQKEIPVYERNKAIDKDFPIDYGYRWIPAAAVNSVLKTVAHKRPNTDLKKPLGVFPYKNDSGKIVYEARTPTSVVSSSSSKAVLKAHLGEKVLDKHPETVPLGKAFHRFAGFSLYGVSDAPTSKRSPDRDDLRKECYMLQDSGGFQLATGVEEFLDPLRVASAHITYADSGVTLDIPSFGIKDSQLLNATARVQAANSAVITDKVNGACKLLNICHGATLPLRLQYMKDVDKAGPRLDALCIGGLRQTSATNDYITPTRFISHVLLSLLFTEKWNYRHYHVLGVATDWQMALLSVVGEIYQRVVTSDSATHSLGAKYGVVAFYGLPSKAAWETGKSKEDWISIRCSCPVCRMTDYEQALRFSPNLFRLHNGFAIAQRGKSFSALARACVLQKKTAQQTGEAMLASVVTFLGDATLSRDFVRAVALIYNTKSYKDIIENGTYEKGQGHRSLFAGSAGDPKKEFLYTLVKRYEQYHGKKFT